MSTNEELEARILRLELAHNELAQAHNGLRKFVMETLTSVGQVFAGGENKSK